MKPIFVLSLPRSGSTLLQRVLASHPAIGSTSEPWIMLTLAAATGEPGVRSYTNFSSRNARMALADLVKQLPGGRAAYNEAVRQFAGSIYADLAGDRPYFLDKTPRYFLIVDYLKEVFPDAKFILLFRDPLDVLSSIINTWGGETLWLHHLLMDLYEGPHRLHDALEKHAADVFAVHYEELVASPERICIQLTDYLDLDFDARMLTAFPEQRFDGTMGDKTGTMRYETIARESLGRWTEVLASPVRRWYAIRYMRTLGPTVLKTFGVDYASRLDELAALPVRSNRDISDFFWLTASHLAALTRFAILRNEWDATRLTRFSSLD